MWLVNVSIEAYALYAGSCPVKSRANSGAFHEHRVYAKRIGLLDITVQNKGLDIP